MPLGSTSSGRRARISSANRVESRMRELTPSGTEAPQSAASIVTAPKQEADGVTIKPLESPSVWTRLLQRPAPPEKSPALAAMRPQHHLSLIHISEPTRLGMISYA